MPRKLKLLEVERISRKRVAVTLYLDRNEDPPVFCAELAGVRYTDATITGLRTKMYAAIDAGTTLIWQEVLEVEYGASNSYWERETDQRSVLDIKIDRYRLCVRADGTVGKAAWDASERLLSDGGNDTPRYRMQVEEKRVVLPFTPDMSRTSSSTRKITYLPYDQTTYDALLDLLAKVKKLKERLYELLSAPTGVQEIVDAYTGLALLEAAAAGDVDAYAELGGVLYPPEESQ